MRIMITGSTGFIGKQLVHDLDGIHDLVLPIRSVGPRNGPDYTYLGEITPKTDWSLLLRDCDAVVHLAAVAHRSMTSDEELRAMREVNIDATLQLAEQASAAGVKRFIFLSSIGVNGPSTPGKPFTEVDKPAPSNPYSESKLEAEKALNALADKSNMELVIIRPPLVYGWGAPGNFGRLYAMVSKIPVNPFCAIENQRSFISVKNLSNFIAQSLSVKEINERLFVLEDITVSTRELVDLIGQAMGKSLLPLPVPKTIFKIAGNVLRKQKMVQQLIGDLRIDATQAKKMLNWNPEYKFIESIQSQNSESH